MRSDGGILVTHTGSLPRPDHLRDLHVRRSRGEVIMAEQIDEAARAARRDVISKQVDTGIDIINDGEQSRESFVMYVRYRLSGLGGKGTRLDIADIDNYPQFKQALKQQEAASEAAVSNRAYIPKAIGEIRYIGEAEIEKECSEFTAALGSVRSEFVDSFLTAASPGIIAAIMQNEHYDSDEAYLRALGSAMRSEYEAIVRHGFVLQLDCPDLGLERHCSYRDRPLSEFLRFCELVVESINAALVNVPRDRVRLHVCWGNYEGPHDLDVPLHEILPIIRQANVGGFVLPFANPRHAHEYRCFEALPLAEDQYLVAGVIDSVTNFVEHPETVAERLERVVHVIGEPGRVIAGTDCGFGTAAGMGRVTEDVMWSKMKALKEGADIASRRLRAT
jgi:5-methyltetrahydropteroyltriglutamate--homocysteine methyltransferase